MSYKVLHPVYRPTTARPTFSTVSGSSNSQPSSESQTKPTNSTISKSETNTTISTKPTIKSNFSISPPMKAQDSNRNSKARFDPSRNSHVPLWGDSQNSYMGHRPLSSQESYKLTRKSVPKPQTLSEESIIRKTQTVPKEELLSDPSRAGVRTQLVDIKKSVKKRVIPPKSDSYEHKITVKIIPEMKFISDPIAQISERYHVEPKPQSLKTFDIKPSAEDESHLLKAGSRPNGPTLTNTQTQAAPLLGGGFFPETAKPGLKYKTSQRPVDNTDVFQYKYSNGISNSNALKERQIERENYEQMIKNASQKEHTSTKEEYMYYKARPERPSLALTEFCYPE